MDLIIATAKQHAAINTIFERAASLGEKAGIKDAVAKLKNYMNQPYAHQDRVVAETYKVEAIAEFLVRLDESLVAVDESAKKDNKPESAEKAVDGGGVRSGGKSK